MFSICMIRSEGAGALTRSIGLSSAIYALIDMYTYTRVAPPSLQMSPTVTIILSIQAIDQFEHEY